MEIILRWYKKYIYKLGFQVECKLIKLSHALHDAADWVMRRLPVSGELHALYMLIDEDRFVEARAAITALEAKLGKDAPELIQAQTLTHFLSGGLSDT